MMETIQIERAWKDDYQLFIEPPIVLSIEEHDESEEIPRFTARDVDFSIFVYGETKESLLEFLEEQIIMLWEVYALADDDQLTPKAQRLKANLLNRIRCVSVEDNDSLDAELAQASIEAYDSGAKKAIPLEQAKAELGIE